MDAAALERIRQAAARIARWTGIPHIDHEDFAQDALVHLIEHQPDWLRGRAIPGRSLRVVLRSFAIGWLRTRTGRWRPSAAAVALGPQAIELERLVVRDRWARADAVEAMHVASGGELRRETLDDVADRLRLSPRPRLVLLDGQVGAESLSCDRETADSATRGSDALRRVSNALELVLGSLSSMDRRLLALRFAQGMSVTEIAGTLNVPPGTLQKRYERLKPRLRALLEAQDISLTEVNAALSAPEPAPAHLGDILRAEADEARSDSQRERESERESDVRRWGDKKH